MPKYRKKPVVVEAVQWFPGIEHPAVEKCPDEMCHARGWERGTHKIKTLEGDHVVKPGDWVITGIKGEHYPCRPDIFEATYEPA